MTIAATIHTTHGDVDVELYEKKVPRTVSNFVGLALQDPAADFEPSPLSTTWEDPDTSEIRGDSLYAGADFHRIIPDFMIQGGDPEGTGRGGPGYQFDDEFDDELSHDGPGVLSMANAGPDTNGSQFFITLDAQPHLDGKHAVFGKVTDGMDVVEELGSLPTDGRDKPQEEAGIESVTIHDDVDHLDLTTADA
ncbi:peptidylprolyl isomerase [Halorubellus sp. JP-L1]|uniref:peptidylprolyl isomerase n=1 Tax=Halorubellus sp. JP-L1 TaxID=2715753 RepID=UPI00140C6579|nr:peptidylprolyl isomerase [Halorubellus sp. JP-L1]NHN41483.1 peptidylprolyl isomerase [Halorubellus sp. JP-L1]